MRRIKLIFFVICILNLIGVFAYATDTLNTGYEVFTVKDKDKVIEFPEDNKPIKCGVSNYNGATAYLIPLKPIVEYFGATYEYDQATGNVTVVNNKDNVTVVFPPDEKTFIINGIEIETTFITKIINGTVYIEHSQLRTIFYRKDFKWDLPEGIILYDRPIHPIKTYFNDVELIFEKGKEPFYNDDTGTAMGYIPIKQMAEFLGFSVKEDLVNNKLYIYSDKGTITIQFGKELSNLYNMITYQPNLFINGKEYLMEFNLINKNGTFYTARRDLSFLLEDFKGILNYYSIDFDARGGFTERWYSEEYLKQKSEEKTKISFMDVNYSDWYYSNTIKLVEKGLIGGYPDGTFKPQNNMSVAEFIKILTSSLGYDLNPVKGAHWATNYINKAVETGIIEDGEFNNYDRNINRGEMARMIVRAADLVNNDLWSLSENHKENSFLVPDISQLSPGEKDIALKVLSSGIITGFPDGSFGFDKSATRAEACTIIIRFLEKLK